MGEKVGFANLRREGTTSLAPMWRGGALMEARPAKTCPLLLNVHVSGQRT